jgi:hypothetical protein
MHGAVDHGGGGAATEQFIEEEVGHIGGVVGVLELALGRESVGLQPWQQPSDGEAIMSVCG